MPSTFLEPETCLMVLKNLMRGATTARSMALPRRHYCTAPPLPAPTESVPAKQAVTTPTPRQTVRLKETKPSAPPKAKPKPASASTDYSKLVSLRDQGILSDQEFQSALGRLMADKTK